jgi:hypothetical protein
MAFLYLLEIANFIVLYPLAKVFKDKKIILVLNSGMIQTGITLYLLVTAHIETEAMTGSLHLTSIP